MKPQEDLLSQTLAKVRANVEPSPELLDAIRAAIVRSERRRRLVAFCVTLAVLLATLLALFILVSIRAEGTTSARAPASRSTTAATTDAHLLGGTPNGNNQHA